MWILSVALALVSAANAVAAEKGLVEGYVRDPDGKPAVGASVAITTVAEKEHSQNLVIPIISGNTVGVVGAHFPPVTLPLWDNFFVKVDKMGHFSVKVPTKYTEYQLTANCCFKGLFGHLSGGHAVTRLVIQPGQKVQKDLVLEPPLN